jgi:hypothetical protein
MKKISFTFLSLFMIWLAGYSQKNSFGIKAGITTNYLHFDLDDIEGDGDKTGTAFGFIYNWQVNKNFAIQPNLLAVMRGAHVDDIHFRIWDIAVPINLLYTNNGFFAGAGPNISYSLDGRAMGENIEPDGSVDIHAEGETDFLFRRFEIGSNVLMGYNFKNGIQLSANYTQGFNNLYRGEEDFTIRSRTFGLSVGYMFGKKK